MNVLLSNYNFHEDFIRNNLEPYINSKSKVAILPFSFSEKWINSEIDWENCYSRAEGRYYHDVVDPFLSYSVKEDNIMWLNYFTHSKEEMINIINGCDIIFLTGGLPEKSIDRIEELELKDAILKGNKIIMGASAGAMIQLKEFYVSPDEDYNEFFYYNGLGILDRDFNIEIHYEGTKLQDTYIQKVLSERNKTIYAIGQNGALIVEDNLIKLYGDVKVFEVG